MEVADRDVAPTRAAALSEDKEPRAEMTGERTKLALTGLWLTMAVVVLVIVGVYLAISMRAHTSALTPGQPQAPAAAAVLNGKP
jgi:hypothetical protein